MLLVNMQADGNITVLFPSKSGEESKIISNQTVTLQNITVVPLFGRDVVQLYAFNNISKDYQDIKGKTFQFDSPMAKRLVRLIQDNRLQRARDNLELVTVDTN